MLKFGEVECFDRVIENDPENPVTDPFKGTVMSIVEDPSTGEAILTVWLDAESCNIKRLRGEICDGHITVYGSQVDMLEKVK